MDERSGTIRLVESHPAGEGRTLVATISRGDVEEARRSDEPVDLLLDVERVAADGQGRETERLALGWEPEDLDRLLAQATDDAITLTFDEGELQRLLDADVEAHGMREKLAVLTVVAGVAAAGAGSAVASPYFGEGGSSPGTPAAVTTASPSEISAGLTATPAATPSEVSTGVGVGAPEPAQPGRAGTPSEVSTGITGTAPAAPSEISTGIVREPSPGPAEITTGITAEPTATPASSSPSWSTDAQTWAIVAGTILALTAVGFAARSHRIRPRPA
jgi:hypothetical protein